MPSEEAGDEDSGIDVGAAKLPQDGKTLFQQIVLLFCSTAIVAAACYATVSHSKSGYRYHITKLQVTKLASS